MSEVFFNRAGLLNCWSVDSLQGPIEDRFRALGREPAIMVYESCSSTVKQLARDGYGKSDEMSVMVAEGDHQQSWGRGVKVRLAASAESWSRSYLGAFYGEFGLLPSVVKIVEKVREDDAVTLLEAELEGEVAGSLAVYRSGRLAGVYCVGTGTRFRKKGVARELLEHARGIAAKEGRTLFLQTLESDGAAGLYQKLGFRTFYRKVLMQKKG